MNPSLRRIISMVLVVVYSTTQVVLSHAAESNFWAERRRVAAHQEKNSGRTQLAALPALYNQLPSVGTSLPTVPQWQGLANKKRVQLPVRIRSIIDALPSNAGSLQDVYDSGLDGHPTVVLIQDVHLNSEAQSNIATLLQSLIDQKKIDGVGVEGAFDRFNFSAFRAFEDKHITKQVMDALVEKKFIAAPSYVGITSAVEPPPFVGIDDKIHYGANVKAYLDSRPEKEAALAQIKSRERQLSELKQKVFSPELKRFDDLRNAHHLGTLPFGAYLKKLSAGVSEKEFVIDQFLAAYEMEQSLNFSQVDQERRVVIGELTKVLSEKEVSDLVSQSLAYRLGRLGFGDYYQGLKELCEKHGVSLRKTPAFDGYIRYVLLSDGIKAEALFNAVEKLEKQTLQSLMKTPEQERVAKESEFLMLCEKLIDFSLSPKEWGNYRESKLEIGNSIQELDSFEAFYAEADIRSHKMVENVLKGTRFPAIVTGGFHTPQISQLLREQKISYVVVSPKITKIEDGSGSAYLSVFAREKTPLDQLFAGEKLFLSPVDQNIASPRTSLIALAETNLGQASSGLEKLIPLKGGVSVSPRPLGLLDRMSKRILQRKLPIHEDAEIVEEIYPSFGASVREWGGRVATKLASLMAAPSMAPIRLQESQRMLKTVLGSLDDSSVLLIHHHLLSKSKKYEVLSNALAFVKKQPLENIQVARESLFQMGLDGDPLDFEEKLQAGSKIGKFQIIKRIENKEFAGLYWAMDRYGPNGPRGVLIKIPYAGYNYSRLLLEPESTQSEYKLTKFAHYITATALLIRETERLKQTWDKSSLVSNLIYSGSDPETHLIYLVTEDHQGKMLGQFPGYINLEEGTQLWSALAKFWEDTGLIHNDLNLENILVKFDSNHQLTAIYFSDVGLSVPLEKTGKPELGQIIRSLDYVAPERNSNQRDAKSDVFSMAVVLSKVLTGPVLRRPDVVNLLAQALAENPAERPSALEMEQAWRALPAEYSGPLLPNALGFLKKEIARLQQARSKEPVVTAKPQKASITGGSAPKRSAEKPEATSVEQKKLANELGLSHPEILLRLIENGFDNGNTQQVRFILSLIETAGSRSNRALIYLATLLEMNFVRLDRKGRAFLRKMMKVSGPDIDIAFSLLEKLCQTQVNPLAYQWLPEFITLFYQEFGDSAINLFRVISNSLRQQNADFVETPRDRQVVLEIAKIGGKTAKNGIRIFAGLKNEFPDLAYEWLPTRLKEWRRIRGQQADDEIQALADQLKSGKRRYVTAENLFLALGVAEDLRTLKGPTEVMKKLISSPKLNAYVLYLELYRLFARNNEGLAQTMSFFIARGEYSYAEAFYLELQKRFDRSGRTDLPEFIAKAAYAVHELMEQPGVNASQFSSSLAAVDPTQLALQQQRLTEGRALINKLNVKKAWLKAPTLPLAMSLFPALSDSEAIALSAVYFKDRYSIDLEIILPHSYSKAFPKDGDLETIPPLQPGDLPRLRIKLEKCAAALQQVPYSMIALNPALARILIAREGRAFMNSNKELMLLTLDSHGVDLFLHELGHALDPFIILFAKNPLTNPYQRKNAAAQARFESRLKKFAKKYNYQLDEFTGNPKSDLMAIAELVLKIYERQRNQWRILRRSDAYYDSTENQKKLGFWLGFAADLQEEKDQVKAAILSIDRSMASSLSSVNIEYDKAIQEAHVWAEVETPLQANPETRRRRRELIKPKLDELKKVFRGLEGDVRGIAHIYSFEVPERDKHTLVTDPDFNGRLRAASVEWFAERARKMLTGPEERAELKNINEESYEFFDILFDSIVNYGEAVELAAAAPASIYDPLIQSLRSNRLAYLFLTIIGAAVWETLVFHQGLFQASNDIFSNVLPLSPFYAVLIVIALSLTILVFFGFWLWTWLRSAYAAERKRSMDFFDSHADGYVELSYHGISARFETEWLVNLRTEIADTKDLRSRPFSAPAFTGTKFSTLNTLPLAGYRLLPRNELLRLGLIPLTGEGGSPANAKNISATRGITDAITYAHRMFWRDQFEWTLDNVKARIFEAIKKIRDRSTSDIDKRFFQGELDLLTVAERLLGNKSDLFKNRNARPLVFGLAEPRMKDFIHGQDAEVGILGGVELSDILFIAVNPEDVKDAESFLKKALNFYRQEFKSSTSENERLAAYKNYQHLLTRRIRVVTIDDLVRRNILDTTIDYGLNRDDQAALLKSIDRLIESAKKRSGRTYRKSFADFAWEKVATKKGLGAAGAAVAIVSAVTALAIDRPVVLAAVFLVAFLFSAAHTIVEWIFTSKSDTWKNWQNRFALRSLLSLGFSIPFLFQILNENSFPLAGFSISFASLIAMGLHAVYNASVIFTSLGDWAPLGSIANDATLPPAVSNTPRSPLSGFFHPTEEFLNSLENASGLIEEIAQFRKNFSQQLEAAHTVESLRKFESQQSKDTLSVGQLAMIFNSYIILGSFEDARRFYEEEKKPRFLESDILFESYIWCLNRLSERSVGVERIKYLKMIADKSDQRIADYRQAKKRIASGLYAGKGTACRLISEMMDELIKNPSNEDLKNAYLSITHNEGATIDLSKENEMGELIEVRNNYLKYAHLSYVNGFRVGSRYYPGINVLTTAITLSEKEPDQGWQKIVDQFKRILPFSIERAGGLQSKEYWVVATLLELAAINGNGAELKHTIPYVLARATESENVRSTMNRLVTIAARLAPPGATPAFNENLKDVILQMQERINELKNNPKAPTPARPSFDDEYPNSTAEMKWTRFIHDHSFDFRDRDSDYVTGNVEYRGQTHSTAIGRTDAKLAREILEHLNLQNVTDFDTFDRTVNNFIAQGLNLIGPDGTRWMEIADSERHILFDKIIKALRDFARAPESGESRTNVLADLALGLGDCRQCAHIKELLFDIWNRDQLTKLTNQYLDAMANGRPGSEIEKIIGQIEELQNTHLVIFDLTVTDEAGNFVEEHTVNALLKFKKINVDGREVRVIVEASLRDAFYHDLYKWENWSINPADILNGGFDGGFRQNGVRRKIRLNFTPYAGDQLKRVLKNRDESGQYRVWGMAVEPPTLETFINPERRAKIQEVIQKILKIHEARSSKAQSSPGMLGLFWYPFVWVLSSVVSRKSAVGVVSLLAAVGEGAAIGMLAQWNDYGMAAAFAVAVVSIWLAHLIFGVYDSEGNLQTLWNKNSNGTRGPPAGFFWNWVTASAVASSSLFAFVPALFNAPLVLIVIVAIAPHLILNTSLFSRSLPIHSLPEAEAPVVDEKLPETKPEVHVADENLSETKPNVHVAEEKLSATKPNVPRVDEKLSETQSGLTKHNEKIERWFDSLSPESRRLMNLAMTVLRPLSEQPDIPTDRSAVIRRWNLQATGFHYNGAEFKKIGHFTIVRRIASGGMGVVYEAIDERTNERVAVKTIKHNSEYPSNFHYFITTGVLLLEAENLKKLMDSNGEPIGPFPKYIDSGFDEDSGQVFLAMSLIQGRNMEEIFADEGLSIDDFIGMLKALKPVHDAGMIHRDVKPLNFIKDKQGKIYLVDFALMISQYQKSIFATDGMGTPAYMPESLEILLLKTPQYDRHAMAVALGEWINAFAKEAAQTSMTAQERRHVALIKDELSHIEKEVESTVGENSIPTIDIFIERLSHVLEVHGDYLSHRQIKRIPTVLPEKDAPIGTLTDVTITPEFVNKDMPAWEFLSALGIPDPASVNKMWINARFEGSLKMVKVSVRKNGPLRTILRRELGPTDLYEFVYDEKNRLTHIIPLVEGLDQTRPADSSPMRYFDLTPYYYLIPVVPMKKNYENYLDPAVAHKAALDDFMKYWDETSKEITAHEEKMEPYLKRLHLWPALVSQVERPQQPFVYVIMDRTKGEVIDMAEVNPLHPNAPLAYLKEAAEKGYEGIVLPIFPTVYSPARHFHNDFIYHSGNYNFPNLYENFLHRPWPQKPVTRMFGAFAGSGLDTFLAIEGWLSSLRLQNGAPHPALYVDAVDINPLAVANVKATLRAIYHNAPWLKARIEVADITAMPNIQGWTYDYFYGNSPSVSLGVSLQHDPPTKGVQFHDGVPEPVLPSYVSWIKDFLVPGGFGVVWGVAEGTDDTIRDKIDKWSNGILQVAPNNGVLAIKRIAHTPDEADDVFVTWLVKPESEHKAPGTWAVWYPILLLLQLFMTRAAAERTTFLIAGTLEGALVGSLAANADPLWLGAWVIFNFAMHALGSFQWDPVAQQWRVVSLINSRGFNRPEKSFWQANLISLYSLLALAPAMFGVPVWLTLLIAVLPHAGLNWIADREVRRPSRALFEKLQIGLKQANGVHFHTTLSAFSLILQMMALGQPDPEGYIADFLEDMKSDAILDVGAGKDLSFVKFLINDLGFAPRHVFAVDPAINPDTLTPEEKQYFLKQKIDHFQKGDRQKFGKVFSFFMLNPEIVRRGTYPNPEGVDVEAAAKVVRENLRSDGGLFIIAAGGTGMRPEDLEILVKTFGEKPNSMFEDPARRNILERSGVYIFRNLERPSPKPDSNLLKPSAKFWRVMRDWLINGLLNIHPINTIPFDEENALLKEIKIPVKNFPGNEIKVQIRMFRPIRTSLQHQLKNNIEIHLTVRAPELEKKILEDGHWPQSILEYGVASLTASYDFDSKQGDIINVMVRSELAPNELNRKGLGSLMMKAVIEELTKLGAENLMVLQVSGLDHGNAVSVPMMRIVKTLGFVPVMNVADMLSKSGDRIEFIKNNRTPYPWLKVLLKDRPEGVEGTSLKNEARYNFVSVVFLDAQGNPLEEFEDYPPYNLDSVIEKIKKGEALVGNVDYMKKVHPNPWRSVLSIVTRFFGKWNPFVWAILGTLLVPGYGVTAPQLFSPRNNFGEVPGWGWLLIAIPLTLYWGYQLWKSWPPSISSSEEKAIPRKKRFTIDNIPGKELIIETRSFRPISSENKNIAEILFSVRAPMLEKELAENKPASYFQNGITNLIAQINLDSGVGEILFAHSNAADVSEKLKLGDLLMKEAIEELILFGAQSIEIKDVRAAGPQNSNLITIGGLPEKFRFRRQQFDTHLAPSVNVNYVKDLGSYVNPAVILNFIRRWMDRHPFFSLFIISFAAQFLFSWAGGGATEAAMMSVGLIGIPALKIRPPVDNVNPVVEGILKLAQQSGSVNSREASAEFVSNLLSSEEKIQPKFQELMKESPLEETNFFRVLESTVKGQITRGNLSLENFAALLEQLESAGVSSEKLSKIMDDVLQDTDKFTIVVEGKRERGSAQEIKIQTVLNMIRKKAGRPSDRIRSVELVVKKGDEAGWEDLAAGILGTSVQLLPVVATESPLIHDDHTLLLTDLLRRTSLERTLLIVPEGTRIQTGDEISDDILKTLAVAYIGDLLKENDLDFQARVISGLALRNIGKIVELVGRQA